MATMRQGLSGFLVRLGNDPDLYAEYMTDQSGVMEREGVTLADRDALLSGDLEEIRTRITYEHSEHHEAKVIMEPEVPPTIMEPEEPPTIMEPEEPPTIMEPEEPEPKPKPEPKDETD
jgi:hypothetical protein